MLSVFSVAETPVRISHWRMRAIGFISMMFVAWVGAIACGSSDPDRVTVAFFNEWPAPNQIAQIEKSYDEALGVEVTWRAFGNGVEINEAMAAGEVDIAYAQGIVPWVVGVSSGQPFSLVGVAFSYSEADNCVVHADAGIDRSNAKELEGRKVATTIGNVTHYKLLRTLEHLDVDSNKVEIVEMNGADAAEALERGEVAMACAFGGPLQRMKELGRELLTAQQQEAVGIRVFDVIVVSNEFADEHPEAVRKFMEVTEQANDAYRSDPERYDEHAARVAGMDLEAAQALLSTFEFPTAIEQKSDAWLGRSVDQFAQEVAQFFVAQGQMERALDSYAFAIDDSFL